MQRKMPINSLVKRVMAPLISPDQYDFWAREFGSTSAWQRCFARVTSVTPNGASSVSIRLQPNSNFQGFNAGQHINVVAEIRGRRISRSYSLSNIANVNNEVEITVRLDPKGAMSQYLHSEVSVGSVLEISQAFGGMSLAGSRQENSSIAFLAAGSGISPLMGLIRELAKKGFDQSCSLLYWDFDETHFSFSAELDQLAGEHENLHINSLCTRVGEESAARINTQQLHDLLGDVSDASIYACGSHAFTDTARQLLAGSVRHFEAESFTPATIATSNTHEEMVSVQLKRSGRLVKVSNQQNLLDALEAQGVAIESGCRMGICNTCTCHKLQGSSTNTLNGDLDSSAGSAIRLCVSRASGSLELDL
ncbi:MAG: ferredoxin-NADP reductase [Zhongshania sp.]|jgi:ferredoxin-NADP reductase